MTEPMLTGRDVMRGPRKGVNCPGCGCRLPVGFDHPCPDCGTDGHSFSLNHRADPAPAAREERLKEALEGFVSDLTSNLRNRETMLTINHDALVRRIQQARAALKDTDHG